MVDFHSHILPYLDDGAQNMGQSLEMARMAVQSGVTTILATPHANQRGRFENYIGPELQETYEAFVAALAREQLPLEVVPAMEIFATRDVVKRIRRGMLCGIAASEHYLIEFPFDARQHDIDAILDDMLQHGYTPLIAHPERYRCVKDNIQVIREWRFMGCKIQLNQGSVFGGFGETSRQVAQWMLDADVVDVIGSDAHGTHHRTTDMASIAEYLSVHYSSAFQQKLLVENPAAILQHRP